MATPRINSRVELDRVISRLGVRLQRFADRKARLEAKVAKARQVLDDAVNRLNELNRRESIDIHRDGTIIFVYAVPILSELMPNNSEAVIGAGKLLHRHRNIGALEYFPDEAAAITELEAKFPEQAQTIIKITKKIQKDVLKLQYPEVMAAMETAEAGPVDTLGILPDNTKEKLILPFTVFERLAVELGLTEAPVPLLPDPDI